MRNPNKYGTCYKLSGKRRRPYIARAYVGSDKYGKSIYKTIGYYATKTEGKKALMEYNLKPYNVDNKNITFKEVVDMWITEKIKRTDEYNFNKNYRGLVKYLNCYNNIPFSSLRPAHYQQILDELAKTKSKKYLARMKSMLGQIYKYAITNDLAIVNYAENLYVGGKEKKEQSYFTTEEVVYMISKLDEIENLDMIVTMCLLGLRPAELLGMRADSIDFENRMIHDVGVKTDAGKNKRIPLPDILYPYLKKRADKCNIIFNRNGYEITYYVFLSQYYSSILQELGFEYKPPKACRHFFATITNELGLNSKAIETMIGHTDIQLTKDVYTHSQDEFLKAEYNKLSNKLLTKTLETH